jgi:uncharacterized protein involved in outer membrane biogenesis
VPAARPRDDGRTAGIERRRAALTGSGRRPVGARRDLELEHEASVMRWRRPLAILAAVLAAIALVVIGGVFALEDVGVEAVRRLAVQRLEAITHRDVSITGEFDLVPSLTPTLAAQGLEIANAPWGSRPIMLQARRVGIELQLLPLLLHREVVIDRLVLAGADVLLERGPDGQLNWAFEATAPKPAGGFVLNEIAIENGQITWHDVASGRTETVRIDRLAGQADSATDEVALSGAGAFEEQPVTLAGELGSIATLRRGDEPYPVALKLALGGLEIALRGQLSPEREAQLDVRLAGPSVAALGDLLGRQLPELGAYQVQGKLTGPIDDLALADMGGTIGSADVTQIRVTEGRIEHLLAGQGVRMQVAASGEQLARLAQALGVEMAPFGPYRFEGTLAGSFDHLSLQNASARTGAEATRVEVAGGIADLLALSGLDLSVTIEGRTLAALSPLARMNLPTSKPYRITGEVSGSLTDLRIANLDVRLADSTLGGSLAVHRRNAAPLIEGELAAGRLDLDRLLELAQGAAGDEHASAGAPSGNGGDQLLANAALPVGVLNELEADLTVRADRMVLDQVEFTDLSVKVVLRDGRLSVQDLVAHVDGSGRVAGNVAVDAEAGGAEVSVRLSATDIPVGELLREMGATGSMSGQVDFDINIDSTGRSIDQLIRDLQGNAAIVAEDGRIEGALLDRLVTDLDILRALPPFWRRNNAVHVNCLVGKFDIKHGVAETGAVLDTKRMTLLGKGTVDLGAGTLDLQRTVRPGRSRPARPAARADRRGARRGQ